MRRRGLAAGGAVLLLLLAGCSESASAPSHTESATVPTAPQVSVLGPTGPSTAKPCQGIAIPVGTDPQQVIDASPERSVFCFANGVHQLKRAIRPRAGDTLAGGTGVVLSGSVRLTGWTQSGAAWVVRGVL